MYPFKFRPILKTVLWGGEKIIPYKQIESDQKQVGEYLAGNEKVLQYLVGQVMKLSKGKANPPMVIQLLKEQLGK